MTKLHTISIDTLASVHGGAGRFKALGARLAEHGANLVDLVKFNLPGGAKGLITGSGGVGYNSPL